MDIKTKIINAGSVSEPMAYVWIGIGYSTNHIGNYRIQYSVDSAWCSFDLDSISRENIRKIKDYQRIVNELTGYRCF
jgi:hypothetical protein